MKTTLLGIVCCILALPAAAEEPEHPFFAMQRMTTRALEQSRRADVEALYDTEDCITLYKPERRKEFNSESAFLAYLAAHKGPKKLLVVTLSKRHNYTDPKQTDEGFWQACKRTGFEKVAIHMATSFGRPIRRE